MAPTAIAQDRAAAADGESAPPALSSAWATRKVGQVQIVNGELDFMASDPEKAYGPMVDRLVELVTQDLRSTWQKAP